ncbi:MAG TPA: acetamidase/formamidase family protein [Gemmatimonadaceae bacterium]|nr:acetamidase/formamidase family protein [Gemmatimonadaceae bacterium]
MRQGFTAQDGAGNIAFVIGAPGVHGPQAITGQSLSLRHSIASAADPVFVKGALLEVGDGHAAQGDGEVDQTAIETDLHGRLQLIVHKDMKLEWPRAETPTHWITMGTDTSLVVATRTAIREMVKLLQEKKGLTETQAYQAASMAADLRITELVDGNVGVHMMIARKYLDQRD